MQKPITSAILATVTALMVIFACVGCETVEAAPTTPAVTQVEPIATVAQAAPQTRTTFRRPFESSQRPGFNYSWQAFPSSSPTPADAQILIEKSVPKEVRPDEAYTYELVVTNRANYKTDELIITEKLPKTFRLKQAVPSPQVRENELRWELGAMSPGQKVTITITGHATRAGTVYHAGNTDLNFRLGNLTSVVAVVEPVFEFRVNSPATSVIEEKIPVTITFRNAGTAAVRDAKLMHTLPAGLLTQQGRSKVELEIGDLAPGATRTINLDLKGVEVGAYETTLVATAADGVSAKATMATTVAKPELVIMAKAPSKRFVGNVIPYTITIKNTGNAVARNTVIRQTLADGTALASATEGGTSEANAVVWRIGTLAPGETKRVDSRAIAKSILTARSTVVAGAVAAAAVDAAMVTDVEGIAAILTEVSDVNDPVPVGENETYEIKATNQGSLPATRIVVKCTLEEGMEFVQATGATKATVQGNVVTFEPLPALDPQSTAQWRVVVKAVKGGDVRFHTSVVSDQLSKPVTKSEATHFYE